MAGLRSPWDYEMRFDASGDLEDKRMTEAHPSAVRHVLLCDLVSYDEMRPRFEDARDVWTRVDRNQDERYHHLLPSDVGSQGTLVLHDLFMDFKRVFSIPTERLYEGLLSGEIGCVATLVESNMHDVIHRFYGFLSRIAVEE